MNIATLAQLMGHPESDVRQFVDCLAVWTRKGYSVEDAIALNERAWGAIYAEVAAAYERTGSADAPAWLSERMRAQVVDAFFPEAR